MTSKAPSQVLVIDDEPDLRTLCELTLLREGYRVQTAASLQQARAELARQSFDVVITDMRLPDGLGMELLHEMHAQRRGERCIVMTAYGSAENAVEALRAGAFDYLTKPVDLKQVRSVVASAAQQAPGTAMLAAARQKPAGAAQVEAQPEALARLVGVSAAMRKLRADIAKVARSMAPVLVRGESGTGKELVARALHACSPRAAGPLVAVNCGAIPEALLEAEFFGARKGSYTGATQDRAGYFQAASGGTLFLDEIGELPLSMQPKLLRAVQERTIRPLGATQEETVDVRIVSATHRDLAADVQSGRFRQDLYYRLNVIELGTAPLRERLEDLPLLCATLLERLAQESGMPVPTLDEAMLARLAQYPLSGNVRELENMLHRALALSEGAALQIPPYLPPGDAPAPAPRTTAGATPAQQDEIGAAERSGSTLLAWLDAREAALLAHTLDECAGDHAAAAARLELSARQWALRLQRLGVAQAPQANADHGTQA
ncbi:sigma-54 dependent transcriptional regulator [Comamonas sp. NLF-1-9]|uniref:sigma-54-dependent transcriptional regulator n=1 Tax=Comamonas sp. NLF-1-9 TaxID=2853163 RepID=UPI001C493480|nr:sigma-54 dependent transcriptional regulator [Comamonas sp. NLF-1-9]QXL83372.1 sigma-54 dependent transcriptional regulator [Comamonas sp. NLF-1-9]